MTAPRPDTLAKCETSGRLAYFAGIPRNVGAFGPRSPALRAWLRGWDKAKLTRIPRGAPAMTAPRTTPDTLDVVSIEGLGGTHRITVLASSPTAGRLIAAAPALRDALRALVDVYDDILRDLDPDPEAEPIPHPERDAARVLLATLDPPQEA